MTLTVTETPPVHPPIRRTVEGEIGGYKVRASGLAHWNAETNEYGPFELGDQIQLSKNGIITLSARASEIADVFRIVGELTAAVVAPSEGDDL